MDEEYAQDMMYLLVNDEDESPGKCIPYFTPCRQTRSVPEEMAAWEWEKRKAARETVKKTMSPKHPTTSRTLSKKSGQVDVVPACPGLEEGTSAWSPWTQHL